MTHAHDRAVSETPWQPVVPVRKERYTRENPFVEGPAKYWTEGQYPDAVHVFCQGPGSEFEVPDSNWVPDEIHEQREELSRAPA